MRGFIIIATLAAFVCAIQTDEQSPFSFMLEVKAKQTKLAIDGSNVRNTLTYHGRGMDDGQENLSKQWIDQALELYGSQIVKVAETVQKKAEDAWGSYWNV